MHKTTNIIRVLSNQFKSLTLVLHLATSQIWQTDLWTSVWTLLQSAQVQKEHRSDSLETELQRVCRMNLALVVQSVAVGEGGWRLDRSLVEAEEGNRHQHLAETDALTFLVEAASVPTPVQSWHQLQPTGSRRNLCVEAASERRGGKLMEWRFEWET